MKINNMNINLLTIIMFIIKTMTGSSYDRHNETLIRVELKKPMIKWGDVAHIWITYNNIDEDYDIFIDVIEEEHECEFYNVEEKDIERVTGYYLSVDNIDNIKGISVSFDN